MSHQLHSESPRALGPRIRLIVASHPHSGPIIRQNGSLGYCFKLWKGSLKQSFENELWLENDSLSRDFFCNSSLLLWFSQHFNVARNFTIWKLST